MSAHHEALIQAMVITSAADGSMSDVELERIGRIIRYAPAFDGFDLADLTNITEACVAALSQDDGLDLILASIISKLDSNLAETAYAFALDIAAADGLVEEEEMSILELLRHGLNIDRLIAAGLNAVRGPILQGLSQSPLDHLDAFMKLYYSPNSIAVAVSIALHEAGLPFEAVRVDFQVLEQQSPAYLHLNPKRAGCPPLF